MVLIDPFTGNFKCINKNIIKSQYDEEEHDYQTYLKFKHTKPHDINVLKIVCNRYEIKINKFYEYFAFFVPMHLSEITCFGELVDLYDQSIHLYKLGKYVEVPPFWHLFHDLNIVHPLEKCFIIHLFRRHNKFNNTFRLPFMF